ncbi:hypothetical protein OG579_16265 [Williamsia herbipolensis]|uniref:Serine/threonine protein kinase n=1 Tax=Williamsia herbipolensis TaxID=1603258 RepID=A0AAU4JZN7_9NOCA|nr:hypothetical protein [Williamsia herbipolensis]
MTEPFTPGPHDFQPDEPGSDPAAGPDPSSRRTTILLAVSAVAAVAIVIAAILIATSGSSDSPTAASASTSSTPTTETVTVTPSTTDETTTTEETTTTTEEPSTEDSASSTASETAGNGRDAAVYDCAGNPQVRPTEITSIYCGDNAVSLTNMQWTRWGAREAVGSGTEVRKVCEPNCAQGSVVGEQVTVVLGDVTKKAFGTVTVTDENGTSKTYRLTGNAPN